MEGCVKLRLSRAIESFFLIWSDHVEHYRQVAIFPWQTAASFGDRLDAGVRRSGQDAAGPLPAVGVDD